VADRAAAAAAERVRALEAEVESLSASARQGDRLFWGGRILFWDGIGFFWVGTVLFGGRIGLFSGGIVLFMSESAPSGARQGAYDVAPTAVMTRAPLS